MTIATPVVGTTIDPTTFGAAVTDALNLNTLRARRVANQSCATGALTTISWDTEDSDTGGMLSTTTVTIPVAGLWHMSVMMIAAGGAVSPRLLVEFVVTSSLTGVTATYRGAAAAEDQVGATFALQLAAGDTISVRLFHTNAGALNFTGRLQVNNGVVT